MSPANPSPDRPEHGPNIIIDKKHHRAPKEKMTGAELKALGGVPPEFKLFKVKPGKEPDEPIGDSELIELKDGDHFYSLPPGRVGDVLPAGLLPSVEAELEEVRAEHPDLVLRPGADGTGFFIEIPNVIVPANFGWENTRTDILLPVPSNYPTGRPPNFFVKPDLKRKGSGTGGMGGAQSIVGGSWSPMCWSPDVSEESRKTLLACVRFALSRFYKAE